MTILYNPQYISSDIYQDLVNHKNYISKFRDWSDAVKLIYPYEKVPKFDTTRRSSRSFYKLYEIIRKYKIIPLNQTTTINISCLCEAPGGFVEAFMNFFGDSAQSRASSIDPKGAQSLCIFTLSLKESNIKYNSVVPKNIIGYGDITKPETLEFIRSKLPEKQSIVTADGGIDDSDNYLLQEINNYNIIKNEIVCMSQILDLGGNFILKIYDCFCYETVRMLYWLSTAFKHIEIIKPVLSRPCNSEKYVLCFGFESKQFQDLEVPQDFRQNIIQLNNNFAVEQIKNINQTMEIYKNKSVKKYSELLKTMKQNQSNLSKSLFQELRINQKPIPLSRSLPSNQA